MSMEKSFTYLSGVISLAAAFTCAQGQEFPTKRITMIVNSPAGSNPDWYGRAYATEMATRFGKPVIVENRVGGGGVVGLHALKVAPPDGYTLMTLATGHGALPAFVKDTTWDAGADFAAVQTAFYAPYVIFTNKKLPVKTLKDFFDYAKANPGKLNWAAVPNTNQILDTYDLFRKTQTNIVVVPYQSGANALQAVLTNEVQAYFGSAAGLPEREKQGQVTILAVTSDKPFPLLPTVPTVKASLGVDVDLIVRYGFVTTPGTPKAVIDKLAKEIADITVKELQERIRKLGYEPESTTPEEWNTALKNATSRALEIAQANRIVPQ